MTCYEKGFALGHHECIGFSIFPTGAYTAIVSNDRNNDILLNDERELADFMRGWKEGRMKHNKEKAEAGRKHMDAMPSKFDTAEEFFDYLRKSPDKDNIVFAENPESDVKSFSDVVGKRNEE